MTTDNGDDSSRAKRPQAIPDRRYEELTEAQRIEYHRRAAAMDGAIAAAHPLFLEQLRFRKSVKEQWYRSPRAPWIPVAWAVAGMAAYGISGWLFGLDLPVFAWAGLALGIGGQVALHAYANRDERIEEGYMRALHIISAQWAATGADITHFWGYVELLDPNEERGFPNPQVDREGWEKWDERYQEWRQDNLDTLLALVSLDPVVGVARRYIR